MEDLITHLCGGYYRSFNQFKQQIDNMEESMNILQQCATFLQDSSCETDPPQKLRFTHLFFETYGKSLAGSCGCSNLILDHQRITISQREFFVDLMHAALTMGVMDCHSDHLARNLHAAFNTGYCLSTLQRKLRENTLGTNQLYNRIKSCKDK